ncbi:MAG: phosphatidate cytidylyltransferase [Gemmobacter sp.]
MSDPVATPSERWHDLRTRLLSAAVMIAIGAVEVWLGGPTFAALVILLTAGMVWEVARITAPSQPGAALVIAAVAGAALLVIFVSTAEFTAALLLAPGLALALTPRRDRRLAAGWAVAAMVAGYGLVTLREVGGTGAVLWLILVVVASDVTGYFVGRIVGGPKFWPRLSPKKTWSGTVAGWAGAAAVGAGFAAAGLASWGLVVLSPLVALAGQMGDIAESWLKRRAGVKDSSRLIPGHGGLLDRFDALTGAAVAVMALGLFLNLPLPQPMPFGEGTLP